MTDKIKIEITHPDHPTSPATIIIPADTTHLDRNLIEVIEDTIAQARRGQPEGLQLSENEPAKIPDNMLRIPWIEVSNPTKEEENE